MASHPLVLVDGPPRCGKSTLARQLSASSSAGAMLARAGSPDGRRIIADPLSLSAARPVILDGATMNEVRLLERILSAQPMAGSPEGDSKSAQPSATPPAWSSVHPAQRLTRLPRFVLVGGPFMQGTGKAGPGTTGTMSTHLSLTPLTLAEVGRGSVRTHWLRGGYPEACTAGSDSTASGILEDLVAGLSGGWLSAWGLPASPTRLTALLACLAGTGGGMVNENGLARMLAISRPTVCRWMEALVQAGILRTLPRIPGNGRTTRTVQAPAWYLRDSGLANCLLGLKNANDLRSMPKLAAASWQAYVLEQTAMVVGSGTGLGSYLSADGASIELVLSRGDRVMAVSPRIHQPVSPGRGTTLAAEAIDATDRFIVLPDGTARSNSGAFRVVGLANFLEEVSNSYG